MLVAKSEGCRIVLRRFAHIARFAFLEDPGYTHVSQYSSYANINVVSVPWLLVGARYDNHSSLNPAFYNHGSIQWSSKHNTVNSFTIPALILL
jgi:hypothetical protein